MPYTETYFEEIFEKHRSKESLLQFLKNTPDAFIPLLELGVTNKKIAWKAAWLVGHVATDFDPRIVPFIEPMLTKIGSFPQGQQRQILLLLLKMQLNDAQEGRLFDTCLQIWENIKLIPSTRITAMKFILKTVKKYPELKPEVSLWTQEMYMDSLSPGIKNSLLKQVRKTLR